MSPKDHAPPTPPARNRSRYRTTFHDAATGITKSITLTHESDAKAFFLRLGTVATIDFAELVRMEGVRVVEVIATSGIGDDSESPEGGAA